MKYFILTIMTLWSIFIHSQCNQYQVYESFGATTIPTQGGTWTQNSMISSLNNPRTGIRDLAFNATGDWIRTPMLSNVNSLSFWYRRSANTTAWSCVIETSPDNVTWTSRGTITTITTTYQQYTLNLNSLGLNNVYVRIRDTRASGAQERYLDDLSWVSSTSINNTLIPFPLAGNCSQTVGSTILRITDHGGPTDSYGDNLNQIITYTPSDITKKLQLIFSSFNLETSYDTLFIYNGSTISSPVIGMYTGTSLPPSVITSSTDGSLTLRFKTDVSNIGTWAGFDATIEMITPLPVELLYFEGKPVSNTNYLYWSTASEHNSDYFEILHSVNGEVWESIGQITSSGNSTIKNDYHYYHNSPEHVFNYYILKQVDYDGVYKTYNPIVINNRIKDKKIIKYINILGQEVGPNENGVIFITYEDNSVIKTIK